MPQNLPEQEFESSISIQSLLTLLFAVIIGMLVAVLVLPFWMPNMSFSLSGGEPKAYWYLSRATAFVSMALLWVSMALGLGITNKMARLWPGAPAAFALHEYTSLLGLAFALFHGVVLLGDKYMSFTLMQVIVPFATTSYKPFWVGAGQISFYIWAILALTFYIRPVIGQKFWRFLHYGTFAVFFLAIFHGMFSGTDSGAGWAHTYYWFSFGSLLFLFFVRVVGMAIDKMFPANKPTPAQRIAQ